MSKYTTEVRYICESRSGLSAEQLVGAPPESIVRLARNTIFDTSLVIGSEAYSDRIKELILLHYYTREIGEETVGLWKLRVNTRLREKLSYYNSLYHSLELQTDMVDDNPFNDTDFATARGESREGKETGTALGRQDTASTRNDKEVNSGADVTDTQLTRDTTDNKVGYNLHSDTPEGGVAGLESQIHGMENSGFMSDATKVTDDDTEHIEEAEKVTQNFGHIVDKTASVSTNNTDSRSYDETNNETVSVNESIKGKRGYQTLMSILSEYRELLINLDEIIINDFRDLFIQLW